MGGAQPRGHLLASPPCVVRGYDPVGHGSWLRCKLAQESHVSLRYHWPRISDRWLRVPTAGRGQVPSEHFLGLAICFDRSWRRLSAGMAVREASYVNAVNMMTTSQILNFRVADHLCRTGKEVPKAAVDSEDIRIACLSCVSFSMRRIQVSVLLRRI